uniref:Sugar phosphate phosphatase n=1 Tax=Anthurium amnicola TaxID=1678845 RepID=A0A1D1YII5_9ARAE
MRSHVVIIMEVNPANPPRPALQATDKNSFAYITAKKRWSEILEKVIDDIYNTNNSLDPSEVDKIQEGKRIVESLTELKYQIQQKSPLIPIEASEALDIDTYNYVLNTYFKDKNWYSATWLFTECYLYRRIHLTLAETKRWRSYDPYFRQKEDSFKASFTSIIEIAKRINELISAPKMNSDNRDIETDRIIFHELAQISLWGNATDLSMLTNISFDEVKKLQNTGTKHLEESERNILANDLEKVWGWILKCRNTRIDFILDNAGFELYGDLVFADWLIQSSYAREVHLHAKPIPWFVSDTTRHDFDWLFQTLQSDDFFSSASELEKSSLKKLANRWQSYITNSQWIFTQDYFWTSPYSYWHLADQAPDLYADLCKSQLVIFKGDLNYRKLVYDCKWETTVPFKDAIGPLASAKGAPPVLTMRTGKSDLFVGLEEGVEERLNSIEKGWMYSGKYAVVQLSEGTE